MTGELRCPLCWLPAAPTAVPPPCPTCGVPLDYVPDRPEAFAAGWVGRGVWRYAPLLPRVDPVSMGEGGTPLVPSNRTGQRLGIDLGFKIEGANPTGSFKDRGATVLVSVLRSLGATAVADDSSGNAGAALAAYAARAGLRAVLYVPAHASGPKLAQIAVYGAEAVRVPGPRDRATEAVHEACSSNTGLLHASHNTSPYFVAGLTTLACELWEDEGNDVPDHVVVPAGGGSLFTGLVLGFRALCDLGCASRVPRVHVAQPAACAPLVRALASDGAEPTEVDPRATVAEGASIPRPPRGREVLTLLREIGGEAVAVDDAAILDAQTALARDEGLYVEPTAAMAVAALAGLRAHGAIAKGDRVTVVLTGTGLKSVGMEP